MTRKPIIDFSFIESLACLFVLADLERKSVIGFLVVSRFFNALPNSQKFLEFKILNNYKITHRAPSACSELHAKHQKIGKAANLKSLYGRDKFLTLFRYLLPYRNVGIFELSGSLRFSNFLCLRVKSFCEWVRGQNLKIYLYVVSGADKHSALAGSPRCFSTQHLQDRLYNR
jgi:hypothetical protein